MARGQLPIAGLFLCLPFWWRLEATPVPTPPDESTEVVEWLTRYGYLPSPDPVTGQLQTWEAVVQAIKTMQRFAGLEETGVMDERTVALMKTPRCSLPDVPETDAHPKSERRRRRRSSAGQGWTRKNISWRVRSYPPPTLLSRETVRALLFYALRVWSDPTRLDFHEVGDMGDVELQVDFVRGSHGDGFPFDGPGGAVAHAFFPSDPERAGTVHFDLDESWSFRAPESSGTDLFAVAVHEFGHALGLSHSSSRRSIMRPYYQGPVGDPLQYQLAEEDKKEILQLYGEREHLAGAEPSGATLQPALPDRPKVLPSLRGDAPDRCTSNFDAVSQIRGETFFFKGRYFWRLTHSGHLTSFQPAQIHRFWRGLPVGLDSVDAVYERATDHKIVFFKGAQYWLFRDISLEEGFPRPLSDFGLPSGAAVEGAFSSPLDGKTYLLQGTKVWRFDEEKGKLDAEYPTEANHWKELPSGDIDDLMSDKDGSTYVFRGRQYWKFRGHEPHPEPGYPHVTAVDWLDCPDSSSSTPQSFLKDTPRIYQEHGREPNFDGCSCQARGAGNKLTLRLFWNVLFIALGFWVACFY
ncbi:matrix metalloproteinase-17-like [Polypterus senegalus]|uniref:matrix metalloproteinase-17-like n=1 Tax=Polypterus senegalus TaxID=55291 RepID=UPI001963A77B|nr:matrix metalloproteinase-17-like [Polypterus senegalus]XP_039623147.1 matrix metalloproteinase-17-like [Polypterus senegalus]XP_039623148.1 matrix metalloproteinase-17-like [Polypterus senegalus]